MTPEGSSGPYLTFEEAYCVIARRMRGEVYDNDGIQITHIDAEEGYT